MSTKRFGRVFGSRDQARPQSYDFRRPDRITPPQLRSIQEHHETLVRNLVTALSDYLRVHTTAKIVEVEQRSFEEFQETLRCPTCVASLSLLPFSGFAVLEIDPGLVFSILETMLGGAAGDSPSLEREITEIEQRVLNDVFALILRSLGDSWPAVEFQVVKWEKKPQLLQVMGPSDPAVCTTTDVRIDEGGGSIKLAIPCSVMRAMRQQSEREESVRRTLTLGEVEQAHTLRLMAKAKFTLEAVLETSTLTVQEVLELKEGDVLTFAHAADRPIACRVNGKNKFLGRPAMSGGHPSFIIDELA